MLPVFQKIEANFNHSFYVDHIKFESFPNPLHFHPDIEILYVKNGKGTRFIGDSIQSFGPGDIVMIGKNVPHLWYSDEKDKNSLSEVIFILFNTEVFGETFWQLPETKNITRLINKSLRGVKLAGETRNKVSKLMETIASSSGFNRISLLLSILESISEGGEYQYLASPIVQNSISENDSDKLNRVYQYVLDNYQQSITLGTVSAIANLSVPSFCRYFKKRTNKTFIRLLNEIRIALACRSLIEDDKPVSEICFESGYNNVSFFIKQFKEITGFTPGDFKRRHVTQIRL